MYNKSLCNKCYLWKDKSNKIWVDGIDNGLTTLTRSTMHSFQTGPDSHRNAALLREHEDSPAKTPQMTGMLNLRFATFSLSAKFFPFY